MGRKAHKPTPETKKKVEQMAAVGIPKEDIAKAMNMSMTTLYKYYTEDMQTAEVTACAAVAGALYKKAMKGNVTAQIFWLKCRNKWRQYDIDAKTTLPSIKVEIIQPEDDK